MPPTKVDMRRGRCGAIGTMLPSLFAIHTGRCAYSAAVSASAYRYDFHDGEPDDFDYTTGRLAIFQARDIRDGRGGGGAGPDPWILRDAPANSYRISAYRIHTGSEDRYSGGPGFFVIEGRFGYHHATGGTHVTLFNEEHGPPLSSLSRGSYYYGEYDDERRVTSNSIYRGHWRYSGYTAFSMYCATPIPIIVLTADSADHPIEWPTPYYNRATAFAGDRTMVRVWAHRWNPAVWENALEDAYESRRRPAARGGGGSGGGAAPATASSSPSALATATAQSLPKFVTDLIIADAVAKGATCAITMEPIRTNNATVTSCYHIFDTIALTAWAASQETSTICPQCRKGL